MAAALHAPPLATVTEHIRDSETARAVQLRALVRVTLGLGLLRVRFCSALVGEGRSAWLCRCPLTLFFFRALSLM